MESAGGARVIYYYHSELVPLFLLAAYTKTQRADLTSRQRDAMRRIVAEVVAQYLPRRTRGSRRKHE